MNSQLFFRAYRVTFGQDRHYIRYSEEGTAPFLQLVHQGKVITYTLAIKCYGNLGRHKKELI